MAKPPPVPALPDTERRTSYSIASQTGPFAVNFAIYGDSTDYANWIEVWLNGVQLTSSAFSLTSPSGPGGSVATLPRPITDAVITLSSASTGTLQIIGARRPRRTSQFTENQGVTARDLNQVLTDVVAMLREVWDRMRTRMFAVPGGETVTLLPPVAFRANKLFGFDGSGNPLMQTVVPVGGLSVIQLTINRSQIPSVNLSALNTLMVSGYAAPGDLGTGAIYTSQGAGSGSIGAIQDLSGTWFRLVIDGPVSVGWFGAKGDGVTNDTAAIQAAHNATTSVFYPTPSVRYNVTSIALVSNATITGEGASTGGSSGRPTIVYGTTSAFVYTQDVPNGGVWNGAIFRDITIQCQNGVRLNNPANGTPGSGTQGFCNNAAFWGVSILQNGATPSGTGISASVAFHIDISNNCEILGFNVDVDIYYSDFPFISDCRIWQFGTAAVRVTATNTFGSHCIIDHCDLLHGFTGSTAFIISSGYGITISNNFFEQVAAQGTGLAAAILIQDGTQGVAVDNNVVTVDSTTMPNWLVSQATDLHNVWICNNFLPDNSSPAKFGPGGVGMSLFYSGGNGNSSCFHRNNTHELGMPFQTVDAKDMEIGGIKTISTITAGLRSGNPSLPIVNPAFYAIDGPMYCLDNRYTIAPSGPGNSVNFNDPKRVLGTFNVFMYAYADGAQAITATVSDGFLGPTLSTTTPTLNGTPTWYTLATAVNVTTTGTSIFITNATAGGSATIRIISFVIQAT